MEKFFRSEETMTLNAEKMADRIRLAKLLTKRIIDDEYLSNALIEYKKRYKEEPLFKTERTSNGLWAYKITEDKKQVKLWDKWSKHSDYMKKQDMEYLFKYLNKYIEGWWD